MDAVPVACLLDGADIQVEGPQNLGQLQAQLPKRVWDVFRLRHPVLASALFACFGCHFGPCHTTCVHWFQRPWLQRMALFANGPGAKLAPLLYKRSLARRCCPRQPSIVGCNVLCLELREVMVHKEFLLHPVPVGLAALLVGRDFFAANALESSLSAPQSCFPCLRHPFLLLVYRSIAGLPGLPRFSFKASSCILDFHSSGTSIMATLYTWLLFSYHALKVFKLRTTVPRPFTVSHALLIFSGSQKTHFLPLSGRAGPPMWVFEKRQGKPGAKPAHKLPGFRLPTGLWPLCCFCLLCLQLLLHPPRYLHGFPASCRSLLRVEPWQPCRSLQDFGTKEVWFLPTNACFAGEIQRGKLGPNCLVQSTLPAWNAYTRNYIDENLVTEPALSSSSAKLPLSATSSMLSELSS